MEILSELDDPANEITDEYIEDLKKEAAKLLPKNPQPPVIRIFILEIYHIN